MAGMYLFTFAVYSWGDCFSHKGSSFIQTATPTDSSGKNLGTVHFNYPQCQMLLWERPFQLCEISTVA